MRLSHDKAVHLSHLLVNALDDNELVTWLTDQNTLRMEIANAIIEDLRIEEEVEQILEVMHKRGLVSRTG